MSRKTIAADFRILVCSAKVCTQPQVMTTLQPFQGLKRLRKLPRRGLFGSQKHIWTRETLSYRLVSESAKGLEKTLRTWDATNSKCIQMESRVLLEKYPSSLSGNPSGPAAFWSFWLRPGWKRGRKHGHRHWWADRTCACTGGQAPNNRFINPYKSYKSAVSCHV